MRKSSPCQPALPHLPAGLLCLTGPPPSLPCYTDCLFLLYLRARPPSNSTSTCSRSHWGFIRWIASTFSFATCGSFKGKTEILVSCSKVPNNKTITATSGCLFKLNQALFQALPDVNVCDISWKSHVLIRDYSSSAQFSYLQPLSSCTALLLFCSMLVTQTCTQIVENLPWLTSLSLLLPLSCGWWTFQPGLNVLADTGIATGHNIVQELASCNHQGVMCSFGSVTTMGSLKVCDLWLSEYDT